MTNEFDNLLGQAVVLDTAGPIVYLGVLESVLKTGFWLIDADVHDCRDGHATKEAYILEAAHNGVAANRKRVFVMVSAVLSVSGLADVVVE